MVHDLGVLSPLKMPIEIHAVMEDAEDIEGILVCLAEEDGVPWGFDRAGFSGCHFTATGERKAENAVLKFPYAYVACPASLSQFL